MKKLLVILCSMAVLFAVSNQSYAQTQTKAQKRIAYTIKNLNINASQTQALTPLLTSYLAEIKAAKQNYADLKDKLKNAISKKTLTDSQAKSLMLAKYDFNAKEALIRKKYVEKFGTAIPYKKVQVCLDLINDKMSKIEGKKKADDDEDD